VSKPGIVHSAVKASTANRYSNRVLLKAAKLKLSAYWSDALIGYQVNEFPVFIAPFLNFESILVHYGHAFQTMRKRWSLGTAAPSLQSHRDDAAKTSLASTVCGGSHFAGYGVL
jgi:hypothetical protein